MLLFNRLCTNVLSISSIAKITICKIIFCQEPRAEDRKPVKGEVHENVNTHEKISNESCHHGVTEH